MTPLLTVKDAAAYLNVSEVTIYRMIKSGTLPHMRVGRGIRFSQDALDEYISNPAPVFAAPPTTVKHAPVTRL